MDVNQRSYNSSSILKCYRGSRQLMPAEQRLFENIKNSLAHYSVLDIGIGTGRTTGFLAAQAAAYTGIDYSARFIAQAKKSYPRADLRLADARRLSDFAGSSFDLVNFSFNGLDYVDLAGRQQILAEIHRVLKPGGLFFFSTHNKAHNSFNRVPWRNPGNSFFTNLKTWLVLFPFLHRHVQQKKHELINSDFAIINDSAHRYALLTFYTTPGFLKTQLQAHGFDETALRDKKGEAVTAGPLDEWIFVSCRKPSA